MNWKRFFGLEDVYLRSRPVQLVKFFTTTLFFLFFLVVFFLMPFLLEGDFGALGEYLEIGVFFLAAAALLALVWLSRQVLVYFHVRRILALRRYVGEAGSYSESQIAAAAASEELDGVDRAPLIKEAAGWKIYDAVFDIIQRTRRGSYKAKEAYYTVFEAKLAREVPHLLFDAKKAKGKQFGRLYLRAQKLRLGAAFEDYFEAYSPKYYAIDTLSFITPEVMEAMTSLKKYDIELINGNLLCYAPLLEEADLAGFETGCLDLRRHLDDNLRSYKDDRLAREARGSKVTEFGKQLLKNPYRSLPLAVGSGLLLLTLVVLGVLVDPEIIYNQVTLILVIVFVTTVVNIAKIKRHNQRKEALFLAAQAQPAETSANGR